MVDCSRIYTTKGRNRPKSLNLFGFMVIILRHKLDAFPIHPRQTTDQRSHDEPQIRPGQDSNRVSLPRPVPSNQSTQRNTIQREGKGKNKPVKWNRHGTKPSPHTRPQRSSPDDIRRSIHSPDLTPGRRVHAVHVDQRRGGEEGHMRRAQHRLEVVRRQGGPEKNKQDCECRSGQECGQG